MSTFFFLILIDNIYELCLEKWSLVENTQQISRRNIISIYNILKCIQLIISSIFKICFGKVYVSNKGVIKLAVYAIIAKYL